MESRYSAGAKPSRASCGLDGDGARRQRRAALVDEAVSASLAHAPNRPAFKAFGSGGHTCANGGRPAGAQGTGGNDAAPPLGDAETAGSLHGPRAGVSLRLPLIGSAGQPLHELARPKRPRNSAAARLEIRPALPQSRLARQAPAPK